MFPTGWILLTLVIPWLLVKYLDSYRNLKGSQWLYRLSWEKLISMHISSDELVLIPTEAPYSHAAAMCKHSSAFELNADNNNNMLTRIKLACWFLRPHSLFQTENDAVLYWIYIEHLFTLARWASIKEFHSLPKWISFKMIKFFSKHTGSTTRRLLAFLAHTLFYFICIILLCGILNSRCNFAIWKSSNLVHSAISCAMLMRNCAQKDWFTWISWGWMHG